MLIGGEAYNPNEYGAVPIRPKTRIESFLLGEMGVLKVLGFRRNEIESEESIVSLGMKTNYQLYETMEIDS